MLPGDSTFDLPMRFESVRKCLLFMVTSSGGNVVSNSNFYLYAFDLVYLPNETGMYRTVERIVPYTKLWSEHIVVTSFARHIGKVFSVAFIGFYLAKVCTELKGQLNHSF